MQHKSLTRKENFAWKNQIKKLSPPRTEKAKNQYNLCSGNLRQKQNKNKSDRWEKR